MKKTFHRTRKVTLDIYPECKYTAPAEVIENCESIKYNNCTGFEVVEGEAAEAIEAKTDGSEIDDYHEYLVLFLENGDTAIFKNSYVDLFLF